MCCSPSSRAHPPRIRSAGFTMTELMIVVTMVGILSAVATPYMSKDRKAAFEDFTWMFLNSKEFLFNH